MQGAKKYSLGDGVRVVVADVNFYVRKITFYVQKAERDEAKRKLKRGEKV